MIHDRTIYNSILVISRVPPSIMMSLAEPSNSVLVSSFCC